MTYIGKLHKGSLLSSNGTNNAELVAGSNTQVLTLDSAQPLGMKWATPSVPTDLHTSKFIVSTGGTADGANYTTVQSAINAASSGDTVFIMPGL